MIPVPPKLLRSVLSLLPTESVEWHQLNAVLALSNKSVTEVTPAEQAAETSDDSPPWDTTEQVPKVTTAATSRALGKEQITRAPAKPVPTRPPIVTGLGPMKGDQPATWDLLERWLFTTEPYFVLRGFAGTGKSFLMKKLNTLASYNFVFATPTNKAGKVLASYLGQDVPTIYSVLGLRMTAQDDKLVLSQGTVVPDIGSNPILVVDEAGMITKEVAGIIGNNVRKKGWRVIYVGDPAQLNPVGEKTSPVWKVASPEFSPIMRKVIRYDDELLALSAEVRSCLKEKRYDLDVRSKGNVAVVTKRAFNSQILQLSADDWDTTKVVAWRNKTVDKFNALIRENLGYTDPYVVGERVLLAAPLVSRGAIIGYIDEELTLTSITDRVFDFEEGSIDAYVMTAAGRSYRLFIPKEPDQLTSILNLRARAASKAKKSQRKRLWKSFWDLKNSFQELRYGYAFTAHRAQGSTYKTVYVDRSDILANPNTREGYRALYVAFTRPSQNLVTT